MMVPDEPRLDLPDLESLSRAEHNRTLAVWLDDPKRRAVLYAGLAKRKVHPFWSAFHPENDPSPSLDTYSAQGYRRAVLVADAHLIREVLVDRHGEYSSIPYAELGGRSFMLAIDPFLAHGADGGELHRRQRDYVASLFEQPSDPCLERLVSRSVEHAFLSTVMSDRFDLAELAMESAVRYCGLWFGYPAQDHGLIRAAAMAGYRALTYINLERHFASDETVLPKAKAAMAELAARTAEVIREYRELAEFPREVYGSLERSRSRRMLPEGVDPLSEWGLGGIERPVLCRMALESDDFTIDELATTVVSLIVGTVGNVQAGVCLTVAEWLNARSASDAPGASEIRSELVHLDGPLQGSKLHAFVDSRLALRPPVAFLPRRTVRSTDLGGISLEPGTDVVLCLGAAGSDAMMNTDLVFGYANGNEGNARTRHPCLGDRHGRFLITAAVRAVLALPSLGRILDPVSGEPEELEQRMGFACERFPLTHDFSTTRVQRPLIVLMSVRSPVEYHAAAIQRVIKDGIPQIERALRKSGHVHFAWFELLESGRVLSLRTVYDGDFAAYVEFFALEVGELFDRLFVHIENAPPLPVSEHPGRFVDVIRANNHAPLGGYLFSAYQHREVSDHARTG